MRATEPLPELLRSYHVAEATIERIVDQLRTDVAATLDETVLAAVAADVVAAARNGELSALSPGERYQSVFLDGNEWTARAKTFKIRYPVLYDHMASYSASIAAQFARCIEDLEQLTDERFALRSLIAVAITSSDRHAASWQPLCLTYESGEKRVYKAGDHRYFAALRRLVESLPVPAPCELRVPSAMCFPSFSLVEYFAESSTYTTADARDLFRNFGALIAAMDTINFCDGHFDNVVRSGTVPVIIDLETAFHSFVASGEHGEERSVLYTGLIGVPPKAELDEGVSAALQMPSHMVQEIGRPFAVADRTDEMQLRYRGITVRGPDDVTSSGSAREHLDDVVSGFVLMYEALGAARERVLCQGQVWQQIAGTRFRQVVRTTLYYLYLLRRSQMADIASSAERALTWLCDGLSMDARLGSYEAYEVRQGRIPIFFHMPSKRDLVDGHGGVYYKYLPDCSIEDVRTRWRAMTPRHCDRQVEIIQHNLATDLQFSPSTS